MVTASPADRSPSDPTEVAATEVAAIDAVDVAAIVDVTVAYCWAIDTRDWAALDRIFVPDATAVFGSWELEGLDAIRRRLERTLSRLDASQHLVGTHQVHLDGDTATGRCYVHAQHVRDAAAIDGAGPLYLVAGRYDDRFVRTPDGWRIARRTLTPLWTEGNERVLHPRVDHTG